MEKVTVIIPAYNAVKDISRSLNSALVQTYDNIEVLVVNDGSTDGTEKKCLEFCRKFKNLKVINAPHGGVSAARNIGIGQAQGRYLFFMDADDELFPESIECLMEYSGDREWVIGNYTMTDLLRKKPSMTHPQYFTEDVRFGTVKDLPSLCLSRNFNCVWAKLYRKDIIDKYQISFDETKNYGEDLMFNLNYFQYVITFAILQKPVYMYRYRFGAGLGTRYIKDEWELQKKFCRKMQYLSRNVYHLGPEQNQQMNSFYFSLAIASLQRIGDENSLGILGKMKEIKKITSSGFFLEILEKEHDGKKIHALDYFILKHNMGLGYHILHRCYLKIKNML